MAEVFAIPRRDRVNPGRSRKVPTKRVAQAAAPGGSSPTTVARIQENNRERRAIERAIDQECEKTLTAYRAQFRTVRT
jgi:hypothetical protein